MISAFDGSDVMCLTAPVEKLTNGNLAFPEERKIPERIWSHSRPQSPTFSLEGGDKYLWMSMNYSIFRFLDFFNFSILKYSLFVTTKQLACILFSLTVWSRINAFKRETTTMNDLVTPCHHRLPKLEISHIKNFPYKV